MRKSWESACWQLTPDYLNTEFDTEERYSEVIFGVIIFILGRPIMNDGKLFSPLMINNALNDKPMPVYGDGLQIRDWLHVYDHCVAIETVLTQGIVGEVYNIGGNNEKANIEIVKLILEGLGKPESLVHYVKDRPGHDRRYAIDNSKISRELGWQPSYTFEEGMRETINWYLNNGPWIENIISGNYQEYYTRMYGEA